MNTIPVLNPYAPALPQEHEAHLRYVAQRRWMAQQQQERKLRQRQGRASATDRVAQIRRLRPGRSAANPLSPVYSLFNEAFLRGR